MYTEFRCSSTNVGKGEERMQDKRNQRSRAALRRALVTLMKQKPLSKISIKELCEEAQVNRSTFYGSYADLYQLLKEVHEELFHRMHAQLRGSYSQVWVMDPVGSREALTSIAEYMKQNRELFVMFMQNNDEQMFEGNLMHYFFERYADVLQTHNARGCFMYHCMGSFAVLCAWLLENCPTSTEQVAEVLYQMSRTARPLMEKKKF